LHSADWDQSYDVTNKTVAVIGYGSSALQIVPTIQPIVKRMDHYVRGKSWISPNGPGADEVKARGGVDNCEYRLLTFHLLFCWKVMEGYGELLTDHDTS
jgi:cation diffusion facilitator CzcD-associated flavoprotein CzcO